MKLLIDIPAFDPHGDINVVIETPKGSHNKHAYDEEVGARAPGGPETRWRSAWP